MLFGCCTLSYSQVNRMSCFFAGPGLYDPKPPVKKVGNTMTFKEQRMKFKPKDVPGPGAYEVSTQHCGVGQPDPVTVTATSCSCKTSGYLIHLRPFNCSISGYGGGIALVRPVSCAFASPCRLLSNCLTFYCALIAMPPAPLGVVGSH